MAKSKSITTRKGTGAADMARLQMRLMWAADQYRKKVAEEEQKGVWWISREQLEAVEDRISLNEEAVSYRRATTAPVAMFQLCVLYKDAKTLARNDISPDHRARVFRRMARLTVSLREFLYLDPSCSEDFSASYYVPLSADDRWLLAGMDKD